MTTQVVSTPPAVVLVATTPTQPQLGFISLSPRQAANATTCDILPLIDPNVNRFFIPSSATPDLVSVVGEHVTFDCFEGYTTYDPTNAVCQEDGTWSNDPPVCVAEAADEPDSCTFPGIANSDHTSSVEFEEAFRVKCDEGYSTGYKQGNKSFLIKCAQGGIETIMKGLRACIADAPQP